jgi:transposase
MVLLEVWWSIADEGVSVFIRLMKCGKNRQKVLLVQGYRDELGRSRQRRIKDYGYLDELVAADPDIVETLRAQARRLSDEFREQVVEVRLDNTVSNSGSAGFWWYSVEVLSAVYESLGLNELCKRHNNSRGYDYDLDEVLRLLVFGRLLQPGSKIATLDISARILPGCRLSKDDVYRGLDELARIGNRIQRRIHDRSARLYGTDMTVVFYDVTNYFFEADVGDDFRKRGASKEYRKDNPLVGMGLLLDGGGMPVCYDLFPGNTHDSKTLQPIVTRLKKDYPISRIIVVADKGLNAKDNLVFLGDQGCGYIVSETVRGGCETLKTWVKQEDGWINSTDGRKYKSFLREKTVTIINPDTTKHKTTLKERVICVYSQKYRDRDRIRREQVIESLQHYINDPSKYRASNRKGAKKYLAVHNVDPTTGEVTDEGITVLSLNQIKLTQDASLDGFYCITTSEVETDPLEILDHYSELWRIEESFRVIKSELQARPVYVWTKQHIQAHFLVCFIALVIERIIQKRTNYTLSAQATLAALRSARCHHLGNGLYHIEPQTKDLLTIFEALSTSLDKTNASITDIRQYARKAKTTAKTRETLPKPSTESTN